MAKRHNHDWRLGMKDGEVQLWCRTCPKVCSKSNPKFKELRKRVDKVIYA